MISVLIPIFNYYVVDLVNEIHNQLTQSQKSFEIICLEDGSNSDFVKQNTSIKNLSNTSLIISKTNNGRIQSRKKLSELAKYNWFLFLDSDVMPKSKDFILNYLKLIDSKYDVIYGGFSYHHLPPSDDKILRWRYGQEKEQKDSKIRNRKPYKLIISANFLIKKSVFTLISNYMIDCGYGGDNYFGALLKENKVNTYHINNEVYHLGLEQNNVYLEKVEQSIETLLHLFKNKNIIVTENELLIFHNSLKYFRLNHIFSLIYKTFHTKIKNSLLSSNPSVGLLQFYKLTYICYLDLK